MPFSFWSPHSSVSANNQMPGLPEKNILPGPTDLGGCLFMVEETYQP